jgi:preprotein translocase subunit SecG
MVLNWVLGIVLLLTSLFLILLVLIQRGRGGGLAGAFGGMGGQSAFGTKAGDLFTRVTIGVTFFWIILCIVCVKVMGNSANKFGDMGGAAPTDNMGEPVAPGPAGANTGAQTNNPAEGVAATAGTVAPATPGETKAEGGGAPVAGVDNTTGGAEPAAPQSAPSTPAK